jgi:ribonuclease Z
LEIKFLGNWSSNLEKGKRNVSFIIDDKFVFDFGPHSLESIFELNIDPAKISTIYISHLHLDHYSGLAELFWHKANNQIKSELTVVGPSGIKKSMNTLLKVLNTPPSWYDLINTTIKYVEDKDTEEASVFKGKHIIPDNGYRFTYKGKTIFYSGDTAFTEEFVKGAKDVDCLIHEMTYTDEDKKVANFWLHSTYSDTMKVYEESGAKTLIPVHLSSKSNKLAMELSLKNKHIIYPEVGQTIKI